MGSGRRCVIAKSNLLPTNGRVYRFLSFNWPDQRLMRNNRRITTEGNSFSVLLKGFFPPAVLFFSTSHSLEHCCLSHRLLDQSPSAPASPAPSAVLPSRPSPLWGGEWAAGQGSSGAASPCGSKSHFLPAARTPAHTAGGPGSVSLTCRVGQLLLRLPFPCTTVIWSVLYLDLSFKTERVESLNSLMWVMNLLWFPGLEAILHPVF